MKMLDAASGSEKLNAKNIKQIKIAKQKDNKSSVVEKLSWVDGARIFLQTF